MYPDPGLKPTDAHKIVSPFLSVLCKTPTMCCRKNDASASTQTTRVKKTTSDVEGPYDYLYDSSI